MLIQFNNIRHLIHLRGNILLHICSKSNAKSRYWKKLNPPKIDGRRGGESEMAAASSTNNLIFRPNNPSSPRKFSHPPTSIPPFRKTNKRFAVFATFISTKPTVLVAEKLGEAGLELLKNFANVDCSYNLSPEELCTKISLCDALIVRSGTKVSREVFESSGGRLKVVGRAGVGIDNVDLSAATEHGCLVVNAPTANTIAAAEHGIALLVAMARNIAQADASVKAG